MTVNEYLLCRPAAGDLVCGLDGAFLVLLFVGLPVEEGFTVGFPLGGKTLFWNFPSMFPGGL